MAVDSQAPRANALKTVLDTMIAPKEAFESIRIVPTWGWALAIAIVLSAIGSYLTVPAFQHALAASWSDTVAKNPQLAQLTPQEQHARMEIGQKFIGFTWVFSIFAVPIFVLIDAVVMLIFDKLGKGEGTFVQYFAAASNIAVPASLGPVTLAIVALIRGADSFTSVQSVQNALPTLALFAQGASPKVVAFLSVFTPFSLWATGLVIAAVSIIGRTPKLQAWLAGAILIIVPALLATLGAQ
ncbi:MAG: YIP1 family protein [Candidatus Eremiobacteraeota bacterium]|nr:YIP1 family protein [Candidatus Eremiobacteraeota bacterium]